MVAPGPTLPPPGWYVDGEGRWRWWDGVGWTDVFAGAPASSNRILAVVSHLGPLILSWIGFVVPLAVFLAEKADRFTRHHSSEALNFQLTVLLTAILSIITGIWLTSLQDAWVVLMWLWTLVVFLAWIGFPIFGAVRAGQGRWWSYPVNIRFVRGRVKDPDRG